MTKILGLFPLISNGGIGSWSRKFCITFPDYQFEINTVDTSPGKRVGTEGLIRRIASGLMALRKIYSDTKKGIFEYEPDILHTTTSGSLGCLRDCIIGSLCKKHNVKTILHNRYGCIPEDYAKKSPLGYLLRRSFKLYDQIWVLDRRTFDYLSNIPHLKDKVYLTPNSIEVVNDIDLSDKSFKRVGFIGNLIPTKGIYELVQACADCDVRLDIIGPGAQEVIDNIKNIAGEKLDKSIFMHGKLPNEEAVRFMKELDIVALPTYYPWEAFPISILEAMSNTKMVISCPRSAIPDMLTDLNGEPCGLLVEPKSSEAIKEAIDWCQNNKEEANVMCRKAYEKVRTSYSTEVIYQLYRSLYNKLRVSDEICKDDKCRIHKQTF